MQLINKFVLNYFIYVLAVPWLMSIVKQIGFGLSDSFATFSLLPSSM